MFRTRITEMLGIEYPIIQGGMQWLSTAELAAAVSNAGGFGIITALSCGSKEGLRNEIQKCKALTDKPFGVNCSMLPDVTSGERIEEYVDAIVEEGVTAVETAGRTPEPYLPRLKEAGIKVIHKVPAMRYAQTAERIGVDAVTIVGFECAGHPGMDDVTTFILVQKAARVLNIPVIAAGGICDARGFVAALALGAEGVLMGTRFMLTHECWAHPRIKEQLLQASELDTMIIERTIQNAARVIKNRAAERALEMEQRGVTLEELLTVISGQLGLKAFRVGDMDAGVIACGQVVGVIDTLKGVKEVINEIVDGSHEIYRRLGKMGIG
ncbi:MAG: nitronate monooxygenase [Deltaproteobacteria bacterium RBG_13_52_11]|nr:MAG: nitronate monooxygenase [Deltaproteobacteria bacterium RBG_13_52_11]